MIINTWDTKIRKGPFLFDRSENEATNEYESFTNKGIPQPHKPKLIHEMEDKCRTLAVHQQQQLSYDHTGFDSLCPRRLLGH